MGDRSKKKYTKGYEDVERVLDHIEGRAKAEQRKEFIRKLNENKTETVKKELKEKQSENNS